MLTLTLPSLPGLTMGGPWGSLWLFLLLFRLPTGNFPICAVLLFSHLWGRDFLGKYWWWLCYMSLPTLHCGGSPTRSDTVTERSAHEDSAYSAC